MGFLDRLLGERNARAVQQVYDRTAQAANRGYDAASQGLNEIDAARLKLIADNEAKTRSGDMWYQKAQNGIGQFIDNVQELPSRVEEYRQANLDKQGRQDPLQGIRRFFS